MNESFDLLILRSRYFSDEGLFLFGFSLGILYSITLTQYYLLNNKLIKKTAFFAVYRNSGEIAFIDYPWSMLTLFHATLFDFDNLDVRNSKNTGFALFLFITYTVLTGILMLNMLIAMMNDTYSQVRKDSKRQWELEVFLFHFIFFLFHFTLKFLFNSQWASVILFAERRLRFLMGVFCLTKYSSKFRVGFQGKEIGINDKPNDEKYYLVVSEKCPWLPGKKKIKPRILLRSVAQGAFAAARMRSFRKPSEHILTELELQQFQNLGRDEVKFIS